MRFHSAKASVCRADGAEHFGSAATEGEELAFHLVVLLCSLNKRGEDRDRAVVVVEGFALGSGGQFQLGEFGRRLSEG